MAQYIDKDALVEKIEKHKETARKSYSDYADGREDVCKELLSFIDTLEVKEVDLEKETKKWWKEHLHLNPENKLWMDAHQSVKLAKHFFELGLKARIDKELVEKVYGWLKNYAFVDDEQKVHLPTLLHDFIKDSRTF